MKSAAREGAERLLLDAAFSMRQQLPKTLPSSTASGIYEWAADPLPAVTHLFDRGQEEQLIPLPSPF